MNRIISRKLCAVPPKPSPEELKELVRKNVITSYRRILTMIKLMPKDKQLQSLNQARENFRLNSNEKNPEEIKKMVEKANSSISYLKMITPRSLEENQRGHFKVVYGDASERPSKALSNWNGSNMDPDSVKRHYASLNRAGFKNNFHAKGLF